MVANYKATSLSAGLLIRDLLLADEAVAALTSKVFPVISEEGATLPYICYRRNSMEQTAAKNVAGADMVTLDVICYTSDYASGVRIAEAVRGALDGVQARYTDEEGADMTARSIKLVDSEEGWEDDAYMQVLTFSLKI